MSTFDELPHDEATSAAYDGEPFDDPRPATTPDDAAAWAAAWGPVGDELRAVTPPAGLLDDLRLGVLDEVAPRRPVVVPRRRRRDLLERYLPALGAAAAVVLVVVGIGALARTSGDDGGSASTAFEADNAAIVAGTGSTGSTGSTGAGGTGATRTDAGASASATVPRALGDQPDLAALATAYRAPEAPAKAAGSSTTAAGVSSTLAAPACGPVLATATLAGRPVLVVASGATTLVVDAASCAIVATLP